MADKDDTDLTPEEQAALDSARDEPEVLDENDELEAVNAEAEQAAKAGAEKKSKAKASKPEDGDGEDEGAEKAKAKPDDGTVPIQALDRERHKRTQAETELAEIRQKLAAIEAAQRAAQQAAEFAQDARNRGIEAPKERPDPVTDPDGFFLWLEAQQAKAREPYEQLQRAVQQQQQRNQMLMQLKDFAASDEDNFRQQHPDKNYDEALEYARDIKAKELRLMGRSDHEIQQFMPQIEASVAEMARLYGISPAAYIWNYAHMHGYRPGGAPQGVQGNAGDNITRLAEVQRQTQSGAGRSGAPREDEISFERLANMSEEELARMDEETIRRAMGG